ncbi:hypothetical protein J6590_020348 [Homalodisca vitripennis]|nr:hypothetical protein J6590_020348 [Homalodisca vitripennis]
MNSNVRIIVTGGECPATGLTQDQGRRTGAGDIWNATTWLHLSSLPISSWLLSACSSLAAHSSLLVCFLSAILSVFKLKITMLIADQKPAMYASGMLRRPV